MNLVDVTFQFSDSRVLKNEKNWFELFKEKLKKQDDVLIIFSRSWSLRMGELGLGYLFQN